MNDYKNKITSLNLKSKPIFDIEDHFKYTKIGEDSILEMQ